MTLELNIPSNISAHPSNDHPHDHGTVSVGAIKIHPQDSGAWFVHGLNALSGVRSPDNHNFVACLKSARTYFETAYIVSIENQDTDPTFRLESLKKLKSISEQNLEWNTHYADQQQLSAYQQDLAAYEAHQAQEAQAFLNNPVLKNDLEYLGYRNV